jgi:hypothetical protein
MAFFGRGSNSKALVCFKHALSLDPHYLPALEGAAQASFRSGSPDAKVFLSTILSEHPEDPTSNAMMGSSSIAKESARMLLPAFSVAKSR